MALAFALAVTGFVFAAVYALYRLSPRMFLIWFPLSLIVLWVVTSR